MLVAHERQHIIQHDTLAYRFLQITQCVFWFNPLIHKAARIIRHDRELLCDERTMQGCCKREYGMLLLREAKKGMPSHLAVGIATEPVGVYERIAACAAHFPKNRKTGVIVTGIAAAIFVAGSVGFVKPVMESPMEIQVFLSEDTNFSHIQGTERFFFLENDGIALDQKGFYEYALSAGLKPEQRLSVSVMEGKRPTLTSYYTISNGATFAVYQLESEEIFIPYYDAGLNIWSMLYRLI
jgi:hypothetical protein